MSSRLLQLIPVSCATHPPNSLADCHSNLPIHGSWAEILLYAWSQMVALFHTVLMHRHLLTKASNFKLGGNRKSAFHLNSGWSNFQVHGNLMQVWRAKKSTNKYTHLQYLPLLLIKTALLTFKKASALI